MKFEYLSKFQAEELYTKFKNRNFVFENELRGVYNDIREKLMTTYKGLNSKFGGKSIKYPIDMLFGVEMYNYLNDLLNLKDRYDLTSNVDFWRYFTLVVAPDIVYDRWGDSTTRFYSHEKRNYFYSIWWYIHLSWQGDTETTIATILKNSTDSIVQITERSGTGILGGYNVDLYREIIKQLNNYESRTNLLRKVTVLNTLYTSTIEPEFYDGGLTKYVSKLFEVASISE